MGVNWSEISRYTNDELTQSLIINRIHHYGLSYENFFVNSNKELSYPSFQIVYKDGLRFTVHNPIKGTGNITQLFIYPNLEDQHPIEFDRVLGMDEIRKYFLRWLEALKELNEKKDSNG